MIFIILFGCLIVCWLLFCYLKIKKWTGRKKRCTLRIRVQVIEILNKRPKRGSDLLHKPIFKVCLIKREIIINSALYTNIFKFELGQELWLRVNPQNMQDFMYESPYNEIIMLADGIGCVLPFLAMLIYFLLTISG